MHPSDEKTFFCRSRTVVTRGSIGSPPRSRLQATRTFLKSRLSGARNALPGSLMEVGARGSGPLIAARSSAQSETVRAIGPSVESVFHAFIAGHAGTRPGVGRKPTTLQ